MSTGFLLLYGSQTGQAKAVAQDISNEAPDHGLECRLVCMEDYKDDKEVKLKDEKMVVIVVSSTGDGDAPDNASRFWRRLKKKTLPSDHLTHIKYSVLGLGDTNWSTYQAVPKNFQSRFAELGATCFYPPGYADDGIGLELVIEPWKEALWPAVKTALAESDDSGKVAAVANGGGGSGHGAAGEANDAGPDGLKVADVKLVDAPVEASKNDAMAGLVADLPPLDDLKLPKLQPAFLQCNFSEEFSEGATAKVDDEYQLAVLKSHRVLTAADAVKRTIEVVLQFKENYVPGDTFCLACPNDTAEVTELMEQLGCTAVADKPMALTVDPATKKKRAAIPQHVVGACTLRECLTALCDLRAPLSKANLCVLAECTTATSERHYLSYLCSRQGSATYMERLQAHGVSIATLLKLCPSCTIPHERLLEILPAMKPRRYSAASSPLADPESVRFILNVVDQGLCSTWLDTLGSAMVGAASIETRGEGAALPGRLSRSILAAEQIPSAPLVPLFREKKTVGSFNPPADTAVPMVMIGPGTGVAPFLGFLQHRHAQRAVRPDASYGASWMFFGNRNEAKDALCRDELDQWKETDTLSHLYLSFSRDESCKCKYVQDQFEACGAELIKTMCEDGGILYVCGNSNGVVDSVNNDISKLLMQHAGMTLPQAHDAKIAWKESGRYMVEHFAG